MRQGLRPLPLALFFFLLNLLARPGDGNQGSVTGSCSCDRRIRSGTGIPPATVDHIRKYLKTYDRCSFFIRFQLPSTSVCGGSQDQWVRELVRCFDSKECGNGHRKSFHHQEHLPHASTWIPVATEGTPPDTSTPAPIQSTQQSTFPPGTLSLNKELTHHSESTALTSGYETTALTSGYDPEAGPEAEANKNRSEGNLQEGTPGASAGLPAAAPVLSLLAIVFLLTAAIVYILCNRRRAGRQSSADLQLHYTLVNQDSRA
ncbi:C-X-C motif chemokine 16 [Peromyscus eremicus]|uniref:C-X-C motif chemokine 16 n=1 Tax=Peromyscus eremicus TaxID=42410 RepID=UPI0027DE0874|nr:C-X-C motif chemokine 16 [Peromyscus eremicus]